MAAPIRRSLADAPGRGPSRQPGSSLDAGLRTRDVSQATPAGRSVDVWRLGRRAHAACGVVSPALSGLAGDTVAAASSAADTFSG